MAKPLDTSLWSRSRQVLSLAAGVAGQELKLGLKAKLTRSLDRLAESEVATRVAQARMVAESLGRLKGAFMKGGQLLSIDAGDLLPPEAREILSKLQGQADPIPFEVLRAVLVEELGAEGLLQLEGLEEQAAAAASIGQVHRARLRGEPVAVKIQYPGIAESIDSDLALLSKLAQGWLTLSRRNVDLRGTFEELGSLLHLEADYVREREHLERYGELLRGDARFVVPRAHAELSGKRVLTMSWEEGQPLGAWLSTSPSQERREALSLALFDLYCREFFEWGLVQTDPNFGNFLVREDGGDLRIVLLDFGATLAYDEAFRRDYVALLNVVAGGDDEALIRAGVESKLLDPRESAETRGIFVEMMRLSVEPFLGTGAPFAFADEAYAARSREVVTRFLQALRFTPPPRQLLFLHRKLGGLFQLGRRLELELDLRPMWERMIAWRSPSASPEA